MTKTRSLKSSLLFTLIYLLIPLATFSALLYIFWPGLMSPDSNYSYQMAVGEEPLNAVIPVPYLLVLRALLKIWKDPAILTIFGFATLSTAYAFCLFVLDRIGTNRILLALAAAIFAASPNNEILAITIWKDIPYTASILMCTGLLIYIVSHYHKGVIVKSLKVKIAIYLEVFFLVLCWAFRYNGMVVTIGGMLALLLLLRKQNLLTVVLPVALSGVLLSGFIIYWLPSAVKAQPDNYQYTARYMVRQVMGADLKDGALSVENSKKLWGIFDKKVVKNNFLLYDFSPVLWTEKVWERFDSNPKYAETVKQIYFDTLTKQPFVMLENAFYSSNVVWGVRKPQNFSPNDIASPDNVVYPIDNTSSFRDRLLNYFYDSQKSLPFMVFWRNGIWLILSFLICLVLLAKLRFKKLVVFLPVLLSVGSCLIAITCEYRYVWPMFVLMPILLLFSLKCSKMYPRG